MHRYFAYGSNLNEEDLQDWCSRNHRPYPLGRKVVAGFLPDSRLVFDHHSGSRHGGVLSYRDGCPGQVVQGVVFEVDDDGLATLDKKEGALTNNSGPYVRKRVVVLTADGRQIEAITYQTNLGHTEAFTRPHEDYLKVVKEGYRAHGLIDEPLVCASEDSEPPSLVSRLFIYGTLMQGESRCRALFPHKAGFAKSAMAPGRLLDLGGHPGMTLVENGHPHVLGETCEPVPLQETLKELDEIEGFRGFGAEGSLFRRAIVTVTTTGGRKHPAWVYLYNGQSDAGPISCGNWRERQVWHHKPVDAAGICMDDPVWCMWLTLNDLTHLKTMIESGEYTHLCSNARSWGGADVIITDTPIPDTAKTVVVTPYWRELSWLFGVLKDYFDWHLDDLNKYEFYPRLAQAAMSGQQETERKLKLHVVRTKSGQGGIPTSRTSSDKEQGEVQTTGGNYSKDLMIRVIEAAQCFLDDMERQV